MAEYCLNIIFNHFKHEPGQVNLENMFLLLGRAGKEKVFPWLMGVIPLLRRDKSYLVSHS